MHHKVELLVKLTTVSVVCKVPGTRDTKVLAGQSYAVRGLVVQQVLASLQGKEVDIKVQSSVVHK